MGWLCARWTRCRPQECETKRRIVMSRPLLLPPPIPAAAIVGCGQVPAVAPLMTATGTAASLPLAKPNPNGMVNAYTDYVTQALKAKGYVVESVAVSQM